MSDQQPPIQAALTLIYNKPLLASEKRGAEHSKAMSLAHGTIDKLEGDQIYDRPTGYLISVFL